jgi:hypothetical protein
LAISEAAPGLKGLFRATNGWAELVDKAATEELMVDTEHAIKTMAPSDSTTGLETNFIQEDLHSTNAKQGSIDLVIHAFLA